VGGGGGGWGGGGGVWRCIVETRGEGEELELGSSSEKFREKQSGSMEQTPL